MRILALYHLKGGVGKSTAAVNLAYEAARDGWRSLLWDLDPQGAATYLLRAEGGGPGAKRLAKGKTPLAEAVQPSGYEGLDLIPASFSYRHLDLRLEAEGKASKAIGRLLAPLSANYDVCFIDCAPSLSLVSESVFRAAQALLVPLLPNALSLQALEIFGQELRQTVAEPPVVWPFFNLVDRRKALHRALLEAQPHQPAERFATAIPYAAAVERMAQERAPVAAFAPRSAAALAYGDLWQELRDRLAAPWGRRREG